MTARVGIMGGTFDPIHHGHLVAASEVASLFDLDEVVFVPTGEPWQKSEREVSPAEHRYLMTVIATASNPRFWVSRVDIDRAGPTYTIDTIRDIAALRPDAELYFITGADALAQILSWKDAEEALKLAHFVGVTRPGYELSDAHLPQRLGDPARRAGHGDLVQRLPRAGRRRPAGLVPRPRRRRAVHQQAPPVPSVDSADAMTATDEAIALAQIAAQAAADKLATDIVLIDVSDRLAITDVFVVATGSNERQVEAIVDAVEEQAARRPAASRSGARASATAAGCCSTTATSSCTSSTPRSGSSTPSSGCGRTARSSRSPTPRRGPSPQRRQRATE